MDKRQVKMEKFLKRIGKIAFGNPGLLIDTDLVYSQLIDVMGSNQECHEQLLRYYSRSIVNNNGLLDGTNNPSGIKVGYSNQFGNNFLMLLHGRLDPYNCVKLYIPFNKKNSFSCSVELFDYIKSKGYVHQSKVARLVRNDSVVVRVNNIEVADDIIAFVNNNSFLQNNLVSVNPFLINCSGIGITKDGKSGISYNKYIAMLIANYINSIRSSGKINLVSLEGFIKYVRNECNHIENNDISMLNKVSLLSMTGGTYSEFKEYVYGGNDRVNYNDVNVYSIIDKAIWFTYNKYGYKHVLSAMIAYTNGNPLGFTRNNFVRDEMIKYVDFNKFSGYVNAKLGGEYNSIVDMMKDYLLMLGYKEENVNKR